MILDIGKRKIQKATCEYGLFQGGQWLRPSTILVKRKTVFAGSDRLTHLLSAESLKGDIAHGKYRIATSN